MGLPAFLKTLPRVSPRPGVLLFLWAAAAQGALLPPERLTDGGAKFQLARNPRGAAAFDAAGRLHAVWWSGGPATQPADPSYIYAAQWERSVGWSAIAQIDDSVVGPDHLGGRHPSLAVDASGGAWVFWHDHRHCAESPGNWIDNTEVYADYRPAAGAFLPTDFRLTTTTAPHFGDNAYHVRAAAGPDGRIHLAWHDFNADFDISDIYLKSSDIAGNFDPLEPMAAMRATNFADRGGASAPAFTVPDIAVAPDGTRHLAWTTGFGNFGDLYYASVAANSTTATAVLLAGASVSFFDPPRIVASANGDVFVCWRDTTDAEGGEIRLARRRAGQPSFDAAIAVQPSAAKQSAPDIVAAPGGMLHLAWIEEPSSREVRTATFDPAVGVIDSEFVAPPGEWARVAIALDADGLPYFLLEQDTSFAVGDVWFVASAPLSAAQAWECYE